MNFIASRQCIVKCGDNQLDLLIYVKGVDAFVLLLSTSNRPSNIPGLPLDLTAIPSILSQLSLFIRNGDLRVDFVDSEQEIEDYYPSVKNVIPLKNKFGNYCNLIQLELSKLNSRTQLLSAKKLKNNHTVYDVTELLARINVVICSNCCGIAHFREKCPDDLETCRICSQLLHERSQHVCSHQTRCEHCNEDHFLTYNKCSFIKSFRCTLTRQLSTRSQSISRYSATDTRLNISFGLNQMHNICAAHL
jgi:hypothetical protein